jgi:hypothetical protein
MNQTRLWAAGAIIAGIILIGFALSVPHTRYNLEKPVAPLPVSKEAPPVTLRDTLKGGVHTLTGSLEVPTVCTTASATAILGGSASGTPYILLDIVAPEDQGVCLLRSTTARFSATVIAPANTPVRAQVNGVSTTVTSL